MVLHIYFERKKKLNLEKRKKEGVRNYSDAVIFHPFLMLEKMLSGYIVKYY